MPDSTEPPFLTVGDGPGFVEVAQDTNPPGLFISVDECPEPWWFPGEAKETSAVEALALGDFIIKNFRPVD